MNANVNQSLRLFYALWPDDATRAALCELQAGMHGRLTRYQNLHVTLVFLGQQPCALLPVLEQTLNRLPVQPPSLSLDRIDYFARKRIAWVGMHTEPPALHQIQQTLAHLLVQQGIEFDRRLVFKPHVTLARDADSPLDRRFEPVRWQATEVALVQSVTHSDGVHYQVLASHRFATN